MRIVEIIGILFRPKRITVGVPVEKKGIPWWALREVYISKIETPFSIVFASVSTHNHFVLERGETVFKQSSPVIKLDKNSFEEEYQNLLSLLNSSVACFWMRQVCHDKGGGGIGGGVAAETWERFFDFDGTKLKSFPVPHSFNNQIGYQLDTTAQKLKELSPYSLTSCSHKAISVSCRRWIYWSDYSKLIHEARVWEEVD